MSKSRKKFDDYEETDWKRERRSKRKERDWKRSLTDDKRRWLETSEADD